MNEKILEKLGFKRNWIYEVIITSGNKKKPNAAPMGIFTDDFRNIKLKVYKSSRTCENLLAKKEFVVNFVDDLGVFFSSIFSKEKLRYKNAKKISAPVLSFANSWLELKVNDMKDLGDKIEFYAEIIFFEEIKKKKNEKVKLINRAKFLVLESLIKSTKRPFLKKEIEENLRVIKKVAPNSKYEKIVEKILREE
jgi:hypothetical protein